ncbi:MAG: two pore domain potassium channel family protein [Rhodoferax sp.]|nr:two pore domain potassium channel family protein [Rhodoferax sp.]
MKLRKLRRSRVTRRGLIYSLVLCLMILGLGGVGFWLLEPQVQTLGDGLWLAFTTAATVGYGDLVPSTHVSRFFSVLVVLLGLAVLSLVTASVAAIFVEQEERQIERDLLREIGAVREEVRQLRTQLSQLSQPSQRSQVSRVTQAPPANPAGPRAPDAGSVSGPAG